VVKPAARAVRPSTQERTLDVPRAAAQDKRIAPDLPQRGTEQVPDARVKLTESLHSSLAE
jgi:hypothetical protein